MKPLVKFSIFFYNDKQINIENIMYKYLFYFFLTTNDMVTLYVIYLFIIGFARCKAKSYCTLC